MTERDTSESPSSLDRVGIVRALREIGRRLTLRGDDPFRARAYERAADAIEDLVENLDTMVLGGRLTEIEGVGKAIAGLITELHATGTAPMLESLRAELPPALLEAADVGRLSADKLRALREGLGVASLDDLEAACRAGRVRQVKGFGQKTEQKILDRIERARRHTPRTLLVDALEATRRVSRGLTADEGVQAVHLAGAARRFHEVVDSVALVLEAPDPGAVTERLVAAGTVEPGPPLRLGGREGPPFELWVSAPEQLGTTLVRATGSAEHVEALERRAGERRISIEGCATEHELYGRLGLPFVAPELRDGDALESALAGTLPEDLLTIEDVRGMVHCHTVYSDGKNTIEEMARAAEALGLQYITITDHSPSAFYARGVALERLKVQWEEIARVQETVNVRILRGTESDILVSGELDYPDAVLEQLDVVIASIHVRGGLDEDQMTARIVRAMRHPCFKIWGHGLGRLVERRPPIACRVEEILDAIAGARAAVEINGDPYRLDLEPRWVREAARRGIRFVVSTDAHSTAALGTLKFGVGMARRAGLSRGQVLNALPPDEFRRAVRPAA